MMTILNFLYLLTFVIPTPFWYLMIVRPNDPLTKRVSTNYTIFLLTGVYYIIMLVTAAATGSGASQGLSLNSFTSVEGLASVMGTPIGALVVWSHMVIMDLIGGHWMYHESQRLNAPRWIASTCIFMTLLSGPLGLFLFMLWRTFGNKASVQQG